MYAAGLLMAYLVFVPMCPPGCIDGPTLLKLFEGTFRLDLGAARDYCAADERCVLPLHRTHAPACVLSSHHSPYPVPYTLSAKSPSVYCLSVLPVAANGHGLLHLSTHMKGACRCVTSGSWARAVEFLDLDDGAGWQLLQSLLAPDWHVRPSASEVLRHRFFRPISGIVELRPT